MKICAMRLYEVRDPADVLPALGPPNGGLGGPRTLLCFTVTIKFPNEEKKTYINCFDQYESHVHTS